MKPIDVFKDDKYHHFVYFWNANGTEVDGMKHQEILYINGEPYTNPEEIHEVVQVDTDLLGSDGSIDFGWHTNLSSLHQTYLDTLRRLEEKDEVQSVDVTQAN